MRFFCTVYQFPLLPWAFRSWKITAARRNISKGEPISWAIVSWSLKFWTPWVLWYGFIVSSAHIQVGHGTKKHSIQKRENTFFNAGMFLDMYVSLFVLLNNIKASRSPGCGWAEGTLVPRYVSFTCWQDWVIFGSLSRGSTTLDFLPLSSSSILTYSLYSKIRMQQTQESWVVKGSNGSHSDIVKNRNLVGIFARHVIVLSTKKKNSCISAGEDSKRRMP